MPSEKSDAQNLDCCECLLACYICKRQNMRMNIYKQMRHRSLCNSHSNLILILRLPVSHILWLKAVRFKSSNCVYGARCAVIVFALIPLLYQVPGSSPSCFFFRFRNLMLQDDSAHNKRETIACN